MDLELELVVDENGTSLCLDEDGVRQVSNRSVGCADLSGFEENGVNELVELLDKLKAINQNRVYSQRVNAVFQCYWSSED